MVRYLLRFNCVCAHRHGCFGSAVVLGFEFTIQIDKEDSDFTNCCNSSDESDSIVGEVVYYLIEHGFSPMWTKKGSPVLGLPNQRLLILWLKFDGPVQLVVLKLDELLPRLREFGNPRRGVYRVPFRTLWTVVVTDLD